MSITAVLLFKALSWCKNKLELIVKTFRLNVAPLPILCTYNLLSTFSRCTCSTLLGYLLVACTFHAVVHYTFFPLTKIIRYVHKMLL